MSRISDLLPLSAFCVTLFAAPAATLVAESHRVSASLLGGLGSETSQLYGVARHWAVATSWFRGMGEGSATSVLFGIEERPVIDPKRERLTLSYEYRGSYEVSLSSERRHLESSVGYVAPPGGFLGTGLAGTTLREDRRQDAIAFVKKLDLGNLRLGIGCDLVAERSTMPTLGGSLRPTQGFSFGVTPQLRATRATAKAEYANPLVRAEYRMLSWFIPALAVRTSAHQVDFSERLLDGGSLLAGAAGPRIAFNSGRYATQVTEAEAQFSVVIDQLAVGLLFLHGVRRVRVGDAVILQGGFGETREFIVRDALLSREALLGTRSVQRYSWVSLATTVTVEF